VKGVRLFLNTEKIFALDIGTRSIVGLILSTDQDHYIVEDMIQKEHKERAMLDGQIHNVPAVADLIQEIKAELELKHGKLHKVSVAAAGRALKTNQAEFTFSLQGKPRLTSQDILHMELSAVQVAQESAASENENSHHYHCVGYSVLHYKLDGEEIGSLIDQQGDMASVEIIATFLPRVVVESLIASLKRADLSMGALTLEPIAAINVLIPPSMRRLNVALVDIGAGTSDIAITNGGTVIAYGMVPVAGDEMTECISDHFLLDFPQAEIAKRAITYAETVTISDILGFETNVPQAEMKEVLRPAVEKLAITISEEILALNNQDTPKAIMLVGGGSLTPLLPELLAEKLQLPVNRVAVRGIEAIQGLTFHESIQKGPELVTPIGIAIAAKNSPVNYVTVSVNDHEVRLFEVKELSIGDAVLAAGLKLSRMYGKPGLAKMITVNGQVVTVPGEHGKAPLVQRNGVTTSMDETIQAQDVITIIPGKDGETTAIRIQDILEESIQTTIQVNDKAHTFTKKLYVNDQPVDHSYQLFDRDQIRTDKQLTLQDVLHHIGVASNQEKNRPFMILLNGKRTYFPQWDVSILLNGTTIKSAQIQNEIKTNDRLIVKPSIDPKVKHLLNELHLHINQKAIVTFNGQEVELTDAQVTVYRQNELLKIEDTLYYGDEIITKSHEAEPYVFQDVFRFINWTPPSGQAGTILIRKNGAPSVLTDPIKSGDKLEILIE